MLEVLEVDDHFLKKRKTITRYTLKGIMISRTEHCPEAWREPGVVGIEWV